MNVWALDLHGLHATEAVHALKVRLAQLEKELAANPNFLYDHSQRTQGVGTEQPLPLAASRTVLKNELSVITGIFICSNSVANKNPWQNSQAYNFRLVDDDDVVLKIVCCYLIWFLILKVHQKFFPSDLKRFGFRIQIDLHSDLPKSHQLL